MPIIEAIEAIAAPTVENSLPDKTLSDTAAATAKPKLFTAEQAAKYYSEKSGNTLAASSLRANASMYGFKIWKRGSGLYILIDS